jgi:hypothetical protein
MSVESDVAAVRAALLPAIARDAARRRRRRWIAPLAVLGVLLVGSTGVAAATGVIWSEPKVDHSVPAAPEWQYYSQNPYGHGGGPVLLRERADARARLNRQTERALAAEGITARCGGDPDHRGACFLPSGEYAPPVSGIQVIDLGPADYDVKELSDVEAHAWLCAHPTQRPGADGGEKPAPTQGYEDC